MTLRRHLFPSALLALLLAAAQPAAAQTSFGPRTDFATGLADPSGVTQLADGTVLVAEITGNRISAYPASGGERTVFATGLSFPTGVTQIADGRVLVAEVSGRVSAYSTDGSARTDFATGLDSPRDITHLADGTVLVTEGGSRISAYPAGGGERTDFATGLNRPQGVTQLADGTVLVAEGTGRVSAFAPVVVANEAGVEARASLASPRPNPARGASAVEFSLAEAGAARLSVVDLLGREVAVLVSGAQVAGMHTASLDARSLAPGLYVVRLVAGREARTTRLVVVR